MCTACSRESEQLLVSAVSAVAAAELAQTASGSNPSVLWQRIGTGDTDGI